MKKLLLLLLMLPTISAEAQDIELNSEGAYEKKEVVEVDGATAIVLYERAMEALSDWTGPDGRSKIGIDYSEKETGTVIYKGKFSLGFKNIFLGQGWSRYADFILKVRCKDGRAQVGVSIPTLTAIHTGGVSQNVKMIEFTEALAAAKGKKHERGLATAEAIVESVNMLIEAMKKKLETSIDDDF